MRGRRAVSRRDRARRVRLDGTGEAGRRAEALYLDVVGRMRWFDPRPGALNRLARDFDVLDDDSVAAASVRDGELRIGHEAYAAIVFPGCVVLEARTAERLVEFVDAGGTLIAARGRSPPHAELAARFASGAAHQVDQPDAIGDVLQAVPRRVQAPVPTLLRTNGDAGLLFVPAAFPRATVVELAAQADVQHPWAQGVSYRFDPANHARSMDVVLAVIRARWEAWEPFSGRRRTAACEPVEEAACACGWTSPTGRARCSRGGWGARPPLRS